MSQPRNLSLIANTLNSNATFASITDSGNLTFTGTGNRITGDFSNATVASRVAFQTSTANSGTRVGVLPNGTSLNSSFDAYANTDPTNTAYGRFGVTGATDVTIQSAISGTGTYLPMTFYTGGSERMRLDTSGNLLLGTTSGSARLVVNGGTSTSQIRWEVNNAAFTQEVSTNAAAAAYVYKSNDASYHVWKLSNSEAMRLDSSGNVGIGTSSPLAKTNIYNASSNYPLFVQGGSAATAGDGGSIAFAVATGSAIAGPSTAAAAIRSLNTYAGESNGQEGPLAFYTNQRTGVNTYTGLTERMRIDSSGNVGIGTSSPSYTLEAYGTGAFLGGISRATTSTDAGAIFSFSTLNASSTKTAMADILGASSSTTAGAENGYLSLRTKTSGSMTEKVRIDSSGNVLVTNPAGLGYGTGSGGTVTQATSKGTAVTLNKPTGQITMNSAALAANTTVAFTLNNSLISSVDNVIVTLNGGFGPSYLAWAVNPSSGTVSIALRNITAGSLSEAVVINFAIIKGATS